MNISSKSCEMTFPLFPCKKCFPTYIYHRLPLYRIVLLIFLLFGYFLLLYIKKKRREKKYLIYCHNRTSTHFKVECPSFLCAYCDYSPCFQNCISHTCKHIHIGAHTQVHPHNQCFS